MVMRAICGGLPGVLEIIRSTWAEVWQGRNDKGRAERSFRWLSTLNASRTSSIYQVTPPWDNNIVRIQWHWVNKASGSIVDFPTEISLFPLCSLTLRYVVPAWLPCQNPAPNMKRVEPGHYSTVSALGAPKRIRSAACNTNISIIASTHHKKHSDSPSPPPHKQSDTYCPPPAST